MTARRAHGQAVIADEPARSPLTDPHGRPVLFRQIRELLLADGTVLFGCLHCDFVHRSPAGVRPHLKAHSGTRTPQANGHTVPLSAAAPNSRHDKAVTYLAAQLEKAERRIRELTADRDGYRKEARRLGDDLRRIRRLLGETR